MKSLDLKALARIDRKEREHEGKRQAWVDERRKVFRLKRRAQRRARQQRIQHDLEDVSLGS